MIKAAGENGQSERSFAVGTSDVPYDMKANIHQGEIIVPRTFSEGLRDGRLSMGSQDEVVAELKALRKDINDIKGINFESLKSDKQNLKVQRRIEKQIAQQEVA